MLTHTELKKETRFILNGEPYEVLDFSIMFKGRGHSTVQAKIKSLITGNVLSKTFHPGEELEETELTKAQAKFIYQHRKEYFFSLAPDPSKRFNLSGERIGNASQFLKPNQLVEGLVFKNQIINIVLPIKINLKVTEAPPGVKGDRAQGGTKTVTLETGAKINTPLFVEEGDTIEVNTETGEYVRRIE